MSVDREAKLALLHSLLRPMKKAPRLYLINASGRAWLGFHKDPDVAPMYWGLYGAMLLGLPLVPIRFYLISGPRADNGILVSKSVYSFHGSLSLTAFGKVYGAAAVARVIVWGYGRFILVVVVALIAITLISYGVPVIGRLLMYISR